MLVFRTVAELNAHLEKAKLFDHKIGFIPTMGALHEGHMSLVNRSKLNKDYTICSIFVNPKQFNNALDLERYPRTEQADLALLQEAKVDVVFLPSVEEIYPNDDLPLPNFSFGQLTEVMEGIFRPGHFNGVIKVMYRLLSIVKPNSLYMGLKDFQQQAIIGKMLEQMEYPIQLIPCETTRDIDGLAMSSRNSLLTPAQREIAPILYKILKEVKTRAKQIPLKELKHLANSKLTASGFSVDYFEVVNTQTLTPVQSFLDAPSIVACVAAYLGDIRLIDNILLK
jgi:pantoate--beta-alanine ligase